MLGMRSVLLRYDVESFSDSTFNTPTTSLCFGSHNLRIKGMYDLSADEPETNSTNVNQTKT